MDTPFDIAEVRNAPVVYVRHLPSDEVPDQLKARFGSDRTLYAVHDADGNRLAIVPDRKLAFVLARQHDMAPVSVH